MEIYLLREEKEVGPYSPDDIATWYHEGTVIPEELAWSPGMEDWQPLHTIVELPGYVPTDHQEHGDAFEAAEHEAASWEQPEPAPAQVAAPIKPVRLVAATPRQKAFLSYMGIYFSPALSEEEAEVQIQQAHKDPKYASRLIRWEEERLDIHPELFAAEIQERKQNRPSYFHKLVQTEGGDCFNGVTKAHCVVIVSHLDMNYPRWDARLSDAAWRYFFPAINEKFPQLVRKEWRPKLKYPEGPKVAEELEQIEREKRARAKAQQPFSIKPLLKALVILIVLAAIGAGAYGWLHPEKIPPAVKVQIAALGERLQAFVRGDEMQSTAKKTAAAKADPKKPSATPAPAATGEQGAIAAGGTTAAAEPAKSDGMIEGLPPADGAGMAAAAPMAANDDMAGMSPAPADGMAAMGDSPAPPAQPKPTEALFNPNAVAAATPAPALAGAPAPAARKDVMLKQPISVPMAYGMVTINAGTSLKLVARTGDRVQLAYMNKVITVPISSTDLTVE